VGAKMFTTVAENVKCEIGKLDTSRNVRPLQNRHEVHFYYLGFSLNF